MSACRVPANQMIYELLLNKAATLIDQPYKAKAYKKVAESVLTHTLDINEIAKNGTWCQGQGQHVLGGGDTIKQIITDFVRNQPTIAPKPLTPKEVIEAVKQNVQARATGGGISSAQISSFVRQNALSRDTKGSGPFGYLADADETEEDDYLTTLIPTCRKITVQKLIDTLQAAIKKSPTVAAMEVVPDILNDGNNLGPYEVTIDSNVVFISSGERNPY
jgi:hypothetical protein